jgi:hypothetical protein
MAETLTYDAGTDTVTTENNLNEDEQSSLVQGEEMEAQEEQLLAGKYKDAQELETAYKELEKKLGEKSDEVSEEVNSEKEEETEVEDAPEEDAESIIDRVFEAGKNNQLNDDLLKELKGTSQEDLAKIALDLKRQNQDTQPQQLTDEDVTKLKDVVGGDQNYSQIMSWAQDNISEQDIGMFDAVIDKGDPLACYFAVQALAYRYQEATGRDGQMVTGKAPKSTSDSFKSQAELIKAMEDDRYNDDPAYREALLSKLERSDVSF